MEKTGNKWKKAIAKVKVIVNKGNSKCLHQQLLQLNRIKKSLHIPLTVNVPLT